MVSICAVQMDIGGLAVTQLHIGGLAVTQLLVIHALTGCDTTSALYNQGKVSAFKR